MVDASPSADVALLCEMALSTSVGERISMNFVRRNPGALKAALG